MSALTLLLGAGVSGVTTIAYVLVARSLLRRSVAEDDRLAIRAFTTWWIGIGIATATGVVETLLWLAGVRTPEVYATFAFVHILPLVAALWGLLFYLAYLYSGRRVIFWPSIILYAFAYAFILFLIASMGPDGGSPTLWEVQTSYAVEPTPFITGGILGIIIVPILMAATAYGSLIFRLREPRARYRVAIVTLAILLWSGGPLGAGVASVGDAPVWGIVSRLLTLAVTVAVLLAFEQPSWKLTRSSPPMEVA